MLDIRWCCEDRVDALRALVYRAASPRSLLAIRIFQGSSNKIQLWLVDSRLQPNDNRVEEAVKKTEKALREAGMLGGQLDTDTDEPLEEAAAESPQQRPDVLVASYDLGRLPLPTQATLLSLPVQGYKITAASETQNKVYLSKA